MPLQTLNKVFLSLQMCMIETLKVNGKNNYKQPHMGKDSLLKNGNLPVSLTIEPEILSKSLSTLQNKE